MSALKFKDMSILLTCHEHAEKTEDTGEDKGTIPRILLIRKKTPSCQGFFCYQCFESFCVNRSSAIVKNLDFKLISVERHMLICSTRIYFFCVHNLASWGKCFFAEGQLCPSDTFGRSQVIMNLPIIQQKGRKNTFILYGWITHHEFPPSVYTLTFDRMW